MTVLAGRASRQTIVGTVCVREWREAIGNKLLVGMTLFPPLIILVSGIFAVAAALRPSAFTASAMCASMSSLGLLER